MKIIRSKLASILSVIWALGVAPILPAAVFEEFHAFIPFGSQSSLGIPDGNAAGVSDHHQISSAITSIESVKVILEISGDFNGDLYAYLRHGSEICILLNRPGLSAGLPEGYDDCGLELTGVPEPIHGTVVVAVCLIMGRLWLRRGINKRPVFDRSFVRR